LIRAAREEDLPRLLDIYNHYVEQTHITFDTVPITLSERKAWFDGFDCTGPHRLFVGEFEGIVGGYASSREFRSRPAYSTSVETSIYLAPEAAGKGMGRALYGRLLEELEGEESVHRAYGGIALPNRASIVLHERCHFEHVARFSEVGFKFGRYWDVVWMERAV
jgi:phosphinothricin acetyltransferase